MRQDVRDVRTDVRDNLNAFLTAGGRKIARDAVDAHLPPSAAFARSRAFCLNDGVDKICCAAARIGRSRTNRHSRRGDESPFVLLPLREKVSPEG